jgi:U4/U6 small nuclear ribonucleoprotein PRP4
MVLNGHTQAIYAIDFSPNGFQVATGGADDTVRIWDIRALQSIITIPAHTNNISDLKFFHSSSPLCSLEPQLTGNAPDSMDTSETSTPLSDEQVFERYKSGLHLVSAGYDGKVNIWSADDWQLVKSLQADDKKVMSVDLSADGKLIASGSFDRSYQLFAAEGYS